MASCIYTVPLSIEQVLKLILFMQYRLLYQLLFGMCAASL